MLGDLDGWRRGTHLGMTVGMRCELRWSIAINSSKLRLTVSASKVSCASRRTRSPQGPGLHVEVDFSFRQACEDQAGARFSLKGCAEGYRPGLTIVKIQGLPSGMSCGCGQTKAVACAWAGA